MRLSPRMTWSAYIGNTMLFSILSQVIKNTQGKMLRLLQIQRSEAARISKYMSAYYHPIISKSLIFKLAIISF